MGRGGEAGGTQAGMKPWVESAAAVQGIELAAGRAEKVARGIGARAGAARGA